MKTESETKRYPVHPEWSEEYPAIDGIETKSELRGEHVKPGGRPVRSDIELILDMPEEEFNQWISERRETTSNLLKEYELFTTIPHLGYVSEQAKFNMSALTHVETHKEVLKRGLDYLDKIEQLYKEVNSQ